MVNIVVAGDFYPCIQSDNNAFEEVKEIFKESDLNIINFECSLLAEKEKPIVKEGPSLSCNYNQFLQLTKLPANLLTLANNHTLDYGIPGLKNIIEASAKNNINIVGAGITLKDAQKVFYFKKDDKVIGIINCCENEFSVANENLGGANGMDPIKIYHQIQIAKERADAIVIIVHGGHEYYQLPSPRMQELYHFFIDVGANVVVGHHPHCFSGMEKYSNGVIFYSLGNFYFNNNNSQHSIWNDGFFVKLIFKWQQSLNVEYEIIPYTQCLNNSSVLLKKGICKDKFFDEFKNLSSVIANREILQRKFDQFLKINEKKSIARMLPYSNHYLVGLFKRGFLPSFLSKNAYVGRLNALQCESHRDILINILKSKLK